MKEITIDTYDLAVCVALWGGFTTGVWIPAIALIGFLMFVDFLMVIEAQKPKYNIDP